jgi:hypothetical protein
MPTWRNIKLTEVFQTISHPDDPSHIAETVIASRYWQRIDYALTQQLARLGEPAAANLCTALEGIDSRHILGCGVWGCVWRLASTERWVVKITLDPYEGPIVAAIMHRPHLRTHPGVIYYGGVWRVPEKFVYHDGKIYDAYVILREKALPFSRRQPGLSMLDMPTLNDPLGRNQEAFTTALLDTASAASGLVFLYFMERFPQVRKKLLNYEPFGRTFKQREGAAAAAWLAALERLGDTLWGEHIADFMREAYSELQMVMSDVTESNVGQRCYDLHDIDNEIEAPGQYLSIIDPGNSRLDKRHHIDLLPDVIRAENPGIPYL